MARYIDADDKKFPTRCDSYGDFERGWNACLKTIFQLPTDDVVPRAELDAMRSAANSYKMHYEKAETEVERLERILNYYALQYGTVKDQQGVTDRIKTKVAEQLLSELKKAVHEKAVQPGIIDVKPYILLKEFDAIITNMSKAIFEEGKRYED